MHIQAYNLDSRRITISICEDENRRLRDQLSRANIPCETSNIFIERIENIEEYDPDQGGRILDRYITKDLANQFFSGAERMCMLKEEEKAAIFHSAITDGMTGYVRSSAKRN